MGKGLDDRAAEIEDWLDELNDHPDNHTLVLSRGGVYCQECVEWLDKWEPYYFPDE